MSPICPHSLVKPAPWPLRPPAVLPPLPLPSNPPDHDTCWSTSAHPVPAPGHCGAPPAPRSLPPAALWERETLGRILNNSVASQTRVHLCPHFHIPLAAPALPHSPESRWLHPGTLVRAPSPLQLWSRLAHDYPKAVFTLRCYALLLFHLSKELGARPANRSEA